MNVSYETGLLFTWILLLLLMLLLLTRIKILNIKSVAKLKMKKHIFEKWKPLVASTFEHNMMTYSQSLILCFVQILFFQKSHVTLQIR